MQSKAKRRKAARKEEKRLAREVASALVATQKEAQKARQAWCKEFESRAEPVERTEEELHEARLEATRVSLAQMDAMRAGAEQRRVELDAMLGRVHVPVHSSLRPLSYWDEFGNARDPGRLQEVQQRVDDDNAFDY